MCIYIYRGSLQKYQRTETTTKYSEDIPGISLWFHKVTPTTSSRTNPSPPSFKMLALYLQFNILDKQIPQKRPYWPKAKKLPHQHTLKFPCLPIMMPPKRERMSLDGGVAWSSNIGETKSTKHIGKLRDHQTITPR